MIYSCSEGYNLHSIYIWNLFRCVSIIYLVFFLSWRWLLVIQSTDYYGLVHHNIFILRFLHFGMILLVFYLWLYLLHMQFGDIFLWVWADWVLFLFQFYLFHTIYSVRALKSLFISLFISSICFQFGCVYELLESCCGLGQF